MTVLEDVLTMMPLKRRKTGDKHANNDRIIGSSVVYLDI